MIKIASKTSSKNLELSQVPKFETDQTISPAKAADLAMKEFTSGFNKLTSLLKNKNIKLKDLNDIQFEYDCLVEKINKAR